MRIVCVAVAKYSLTQATCRQTHFNNLTVDSLVIYNAHGWPAFLNKIAVYCSGNNKNLLTVKLMRETTNLHVALQAVLEIFKYSAPYPRSFTPTILRRYRVPYFAIAYKRTE